MVEFTKKSVAKAALAAVKKGLPFETKTYKHGSNQCYFECGEFYLCFSVQHRQLKPDSGFCFCINYGVQPAVVFEDDTFDYGGRFPTEITCLIRSRLNRSDMKDQWWRVATEADLQPNLLRIENATEREWYREISRLVDLRCYLDRLSHHRGPIFIHAQRLIGTRLGQRLSVGDGGG